jgi:nitrite reductase/ring-hydroxylating ferredoxin subunit
MTENISSSNFLKLTGVIGEVFLLINRKYSDLVRGATQTNLPQIEGGWTYSEGILNLDLTKLPEIGNLGGAVRIEGDVLPNPILVLLGEDGNFYAFKNVCTHAGRMMDPVAGTMTLKCSSVICKNRSTFDCQGNVHSGLAEGALTSYKLSIEDDQMRIIL